MVNMGGAPPSSNVKEGLTGTRCLVPVGPLPLAAFGLGVVAGGGVIDPRQPFGCLYLGS